MNSVLKSFTLSCMSKKDNQFFHVAMAMLMLGFVGIWFPCNCAFLLGVEVVTTLADPLLSPEGWVEIAVEPIGKVPPVVDVEFSFGMVIILLLTRAGAPTFAEPTIPAIFSKSLAGL